MCGERALAGKAPLHITWHHMTYLYLDRVHPGDPALPARVNVMTGQRSYRALTTGLMALTRKLQQYILSRVVFHSRCADSENSSFPDQCKHWRGCFLLLLLLLSAVTAAICGPFQLLLKTGKTSLRKVFNSRS